MTSQIPIALVAGDDEQYIWRAMRRDGGGGDGGLCGPFSDSGADNSRGRTPEETTAVQDGHCAAVLTFGACLGFVFQMPDIGNDSVLTILPRDFFWNLTVPVGNIR